MCHQRKREKKGENMKGEKYVAEESCHKGIKVTPRQKSQE
jgi:hypothetical protein